eukprot:TRINITY_DN64_c0_g1_i11.p1 TRINITY_DN64_c0_g1~~TRINITY_DN64_c0_g1_i11.p1  ORF type:complete len:653 (-),score=128.48 TRINITY_DN64_c0_g1_i11:1740-3698(-)
MGSEYQEADDSKPLIHRVEVPHRDFGEEARFALKPLKDLLVEDEDPFHEYRGKTEIQQAFVTLKTIFPIVGWVAEYKLKWLVGDIIAGLTIASLAIPQDLGYAKLANLPSVNGLYSSFVPPLIYAVLGSSRHVAIGPVSVVSSLLGNQLKDYYEPTIGKDKKTNPNYYDLAITATFFAGIVQAGMGLLRLGFVVDFLSHAAVVGFMAGAAITIGLGQLKGLLGYTTFTSKADIVSIFKSVDNYSDEFQWRSFLIGISFFIFMMTMKQVSKAFKNNKPLFFINALGPLISVIISTICVYATQADKHGVKIVGHIKKGINPSSLQHIRFDGSFGSDGAKVGIICGLVALTEAVAIGRTFAALHGYHIDGNQEMLAIGCGNIFGSMTSCYIATGSFSRSAVNHAAGAKTALTNIVMAIVVLITLLAITPLFKYLPSAVLSAIIMAAVIGLIDVVAAWHIWKTDKLDFVCLLGAFFGVLFISVEIGLLIAVSISALRILLQVARPHTAILGRIPGTSVYRNVTQYAGAEMTPGLLVLRIDATIYFANANYIREKVERLASRYEEKNAGTKLQYIILELTPVADIDTTGVFALKELNSALKKNDIQLGLSNPPRPVLWKLESSGFAETLGQENLFLSVGDGVRVYSTLVRKTIGNDV